MSSSTGSSSSGTARNSVPYQTKFGAGQVPYFFDRPWYRIINPSADGGRSLLGEYPEAFNHLIICAAPSTLPGSNKPFINQNGKQARMFAVFRDILDFWEYMRYWPADRQNFFEVVPGSRAQKPHFDIDITAEKARKYPNMSLDVVASTVLSQVIDGCLAVFKQWGLVPNLNEQLLVYSSHGPEKRSFHVVWNGYCHANNAEAEAFYKAVVSWITTTYGNTYIELVDKSVYSVLQNFRLLGSSKAGSGRTKVLHHELVLSNQVIIHCYRDTSAYHNIERRAITDLTESLLSDTNDCHMLPRLITVTKTYSYTSSSSQELTEAEVEECMGMMREKIEDAPFTLREVRGIFVILNREAPTWCPLCPNLEEPHAAEHPYMFVREHTVYWNCRRTPEEKSLRLGCLMSRSHSVTDIVPEDNSYAQKKWEIQWGLGTGQSASPSPSPNSISSPQPSPLSLSIEVVDSTLPVFSSEPLTPNPIYSSSGYAPRGMSAQEQVRRVQALHQQQKHQRQERKQYKSLSQLMAQEPLDVVIPIPLPVSQPYHMMFTPNSTDYSGSDQSSSTNVGQYHNYPDTTISSNNGQYPRLDLEKGPPLGADPLIERVTGIGKRIRRYK